MAYFHELSSRVSFQEARLACESEGGALLSLENEAEQKLIESMLQNLTKPGTGISDGDFWIGLWRNGDGQASGTCPDLYRWSDGSTSQYRNWYTDEPSCGSEKCVVMYHQPTANPGLGGPYLYQWNDDRCNMKHNYICKYEPEINPTAPGEKTYFTNQPGDTQQNVVVTEAVKEEQKLAQTSLHCGFQKARGKKVAWKYKNLLTWLQKRKQSFVILDMYKEWHQNLSLEWLEISEDLRDEL
ncbi:chondrolectin isoform X2 [Pteronotus mesoamericanus]|uniref:chondrolectin isoform X2 n=1 Tax=Pteronotus mesoamericanus TaxID=1884717 RepID=UPI0023ED24C9|nr:chondrolectin isoform X2 [Pteronotus parnellii mesoamericanus]